MKIRFNHSGDEPDKKSKKLDTPPSTLKKVRDLIEKEGYYSSTELAERLNGFKPGDERPTEPKFPRATGTGDWTSADVFSLLERKDMEDLKPMLVSNRPKPAEATVGGAGISPLAFRQALADDLTTLLKGHSDSLSGDIAQIAAVGLGSSQTLKELVSEIQELARTPSGASDLTAIKAAVSDALNTRLRGFPVEGNDVATDILDKVVADTADEVCKVFETVIEKSDLPSVKRMSEAAARNVGEICKKIDDTTAELFDTLKEGMGSLDKAVSDQCGEISTIVVEHIDQRFAAFMLSIKEEVQQTIDESVKGIVRTSLKEGMGSLQSSHAVQVGHFEKILIREVTGRLDKIDVRLKALEDMEEEWGKNDS